MSQLLRNLSLLGRFQRTQLEITRPHNNSLECQRRGLLSRSSARSLETQTNASPHVNPFIAGKLERPQKSCEKRNESNQFYFVLGIEFMRLPFAHRFVRSACAGATTTTPIAPAQPVPPGRRGHENGQAQR